MVTFLWVVYDTVCVVVGFWFMDRKLKSSEKWTMGVLAALGIGLAIFGWRAEHRDSIAQAHAQADMSRELNSQNEQIADLKQQSRDSEHQLIIMIEDIATCTPEGFKKQALQLSADLFKLARDNQHVQPMAGHAEYNAAFYPTLEPEERARRIKAWRDLRHQAMEQQKRDDDATKVAYSKNFADRVMAVRTKLIENGQTQWSHDASYYEAPQSISDVQIIASELATNAQALP